MQYRIFSIRYSLTLNDISLAEKGQSCSRSFLFGYCKNWRLSNREKCIFREIPALARRNSDGNKFKLDNTWYFFYPKYSCVANVGENMESYRSIPDMFSRTHIYTYMYIHIYMYILLEYMALSYRVTFNAKWWRITSAILHNMCQRACNSAAILFKWQSRIADWDDSLVYITTNIFYDSNDHIYYIEKNIILLPRKAITQFIFLFLSFFFLVVFFSTKNIFLIIVLKYTHHKC